MIRFLAGAILGALCGYAFAVLHIVDGMSAWDVERRTRPNVVPLTPREHVALRRHLRQYGDEPLGVG